MTTFTPPKEEEQMSAFSAFAMITLAVASLGFGIFVLTARADVLPVTVTINKYIDGVQATALSASSSAFPMSASWVIGGTPGGPASFALTADGYNGDPTPMSTHHKMCISPTCRRTRHITT